MTKLLNLLLRHDVCCCGMIDMEHPVSLGVFLNLEMIEQGKNNLDIKTMIIKNIPICTHTYLLS